MTIGMWLNPINVLNYLLLVAPQNAYTLGHTHYSNILRRHSSGYLGVTGKIFPNGKGSDPENGVVWPKC